MFPRQSVLAFVALQALLGASALPSRAEGVTGRDRPVSVVEAQEILGKSIVLDEIIRAASVLCVSDVPAHRMLLVKIICDPAFLERVDSREDYSIRPDYLRIKDLLKAIGKLGDAKAADFLVGLANDAGFVAHDARVRSIVRAAYEIRKPTENLLKYLDSIAIPRSTYVGIVQQGLANMGTPESCALFEKRALSEEYKANSRALWFTDILVSRRNNPAIVAMYKRILKADLKDKQFCETVVLSLFDYRPWQWYRIDAGDPSVQPWRAATDEVLKELLEIAAIALKLDVSLDTKQSVKRARDVIEDILEERRRAGRTAAEVKPRTEGSAMSAGEAGKILAQSQDLDQLVRGANALCRSAQQEHRKLLVKFLCDPGFLVRLDSSDDYKLRPDFLRIRDVLRAVGKVGGENASEVLAEVAKDGAFLAHPARVSALVSASACIAKPTEALLKVLDSIAASKSAPIEAVLRSLARMGTVESCALFEKWALRTGDVYDRGRWFLKCLVSWRHNPAIVALYKRVLNSEKEHWTLEFIVLSLFDYRPEMYEPDGGIPVPPPWREASDEILREILAIAGSALRLDVSEEAKSSVRKTRDEIEGILRERKGTSPRP